MHLADRLALRRKVPKAAFRSRPSRWGIPARPSVRGGRGADYAKREALDTATGHRGRLGRRKAGRRKGNGHEPLGTKGMGSS